MPTRQSNRLSIHPPARALFPKSANAMVRVLNAWRQEDDPTGATRPAPNGPDGWTSIHEPATLAVLQQLRRRGFTWVNLHCGGCARSHKDARIDSLV